MSRGDLSDLPQSYLRDSQVRSLREYRLTSSGNRKQEPSLDQSPYKNNVKYATASLQGFSVASRLVCTRCVVWCPSKVGTAMQAHA